MNIAIEDSKLLKEPCYNALGFLPIVGWFISVTWPVHLYQTIICFAVGIMLESYSLLPYFSGVRERIITVNDWWIPLSSESQLSSIVLAIEQGLFCLIVWVWIRRSFIRWTLSYTRWLYYPDASQDKSFWGMVCRFGLWFCWGSCPTTFDTEAILPSLPLPPVKLTIERLLGSLAPCLGPESHEYENIKEDLDKWSSDFASGSQRRLKAKKWASGNHVTPWWESYNFLTHRSSGNSDKIYGAFQMADPNFTSNPLARAAVLLYLYGNMRMLVKAGLIRPQMFEGKVPMCMQQWHRLFATTRVPGEEHDDLWTYPPSVSKHVVVMHAGYYYSISLFTKWRRIVSPDILQHALQFIVEDSRKRLENEQEPPFSPAPFTSMTRDDWYKCRSDFFVYGVNCESLEIIEKALCFIHLDLEKSFSLTGLRGNIWSDKCINFVVYQNARVGLHVDQSAVDANVLCSFLERLRVAEDHSLYDVQTGDALPMQGADTDCDEPAALQWNFFQEMRPVLTSANQRLLKFEKTRASLQLQMNQFGRSQIKQQWNLPADAFIQAAIHVAFYRLNGKFALCAETVPVRLFNNGRTETLRSLTTEMTDFVKSFSKLKFSGNGSESPDKDDCVALLRTACVRHQCLMRHALTGKGVDSHLLTLFIATRIRTWLPCTALENVLNLPFDVITCRLPNSPAQGAWHLNPPLPREATCLSVTYACRSDPEHLQFCATGVNPRVGHFVEVLKKTLLELQELLT